LQAEGYSVEVPESPARLQEMLIEGNSSEYGTTANVLHPMSVDDYRRLCPFVEEIEREWGPAPGTLNADGAGVLISGVQLGNVAVCVQPTFGYEGDPTRLMMAESGAPHHGFMGLYTYLEKVYGADAVIHIGTHGALEFMPGKQVGLSERCWPDRLMGELPNIYLYSVNNPAEGTIAKRRSSATLISYLTPPLQSAGLYKGLASLKELITAYRASEDESERARLYETIESTAAELRLN
jgi:magnesium chelatase subunit H